MQTVFYSDLNDFCRKYLVQGSPLTVNDVADFAPRLQNMRASLFEQFLFFDKIALKVYGENIPFALLFNECGERAIEELIEQESISFVLWTPLVVYMKSEIPGVNPIASGAVNSAAHSDPEKSAELGLAWLKQQPTPKQKRRLVKKIIPLYRLPSAHLSKNAVEITNSAFNSGKLQSFGLSPDRRPLQSLVESERALLCNCAAELLEYSFLVESNMTSYSSFRYYSFFSESLRKIQTATHIAKDFDEIAQLENVPNLKELYPHIHEGLRQIARLRIKRSAVKFRKWLAEAKASEKDVSLVKHYVDSIANAKGIFDSAPGKFSKSVAMVAAGGGIGAAIEGSLSGAAWGAVASKILEPLVDLGLDLVDAFLLERLLKGWTPRIFLDDLRQLRNDPGAPSHAGK